MALFGVVVGILSVWATYAESIKETAIISKCVAVISALIAVIGARTEIQ